MCVATLRLEALNGAFMSCWNWKQLMNRRWKISLSVSNSWWNVSYQIHSFSQSFFFPTFAVCDDIIMITRNCERLRHSVGSSNYLRHHPAHFCRHYGTLLVTILLSHYKECFFFFVCLAVCVDILLTARDTKRLRCSVRLGLRSGGSLGWALDWGFEWSNCLG